MRVVDPEVVDAVWSVVEARIPAREDNHPLGCHRSRIPDLICFRANADQVGDRLLVGNRRVAPGREQCRTPHCGRDATNGPKAGVFDALTTEAIEAYDRICGLDLTEVSVDGSAHKHLAEVPEPGNPCDRAKSGWKWSLLTDRAGIPVGWATGSANRHDSILFEPTLAAVDSRGLTPDIETLHPDRGHDSNRIREQATARGIDDINCVNKTQTRHSHGQETSPTRDAMDHRTNQLVAIQLRAATPQHQPPTPTPTSAAQPHHCPDHHHQTHRLAKPMEPYQLTPIRAPS